MMMWESRQADRAAGDTCNVDRFAIELPTCIYTDGDASVEIVLRDVSAGGFMGECEQFVQIGSCVGVKLPGLGRVEATIMWALEGRIGGRFMTPIPVSQLVAYRP
jgi:hypothetical protein